MISRQELKALSNPAFRGIALALALTAPAGAAEDSTMLPLVVAKDCSEWAGARPNFCTITESNLAALTKGTKVFYYGPVDSNPNFSSNLIVLDDGAGDTAVGHCIVDFGAGPKGMCAFHAGSGTLQGFTAIVAVTVDAAGLWHWEGNYALEAGGQ